MQQYQVPLFIESEAMIFGPLTLLQFLILGAAGAIVLIALSITQSIIGTVAIGIIVGIPAFYLAMGRVNGEMVPKILIFSIKFRLTPKMALWQKAGEEGLSLKEIQRVFEERRKLIKTTKESRLKKIAWEVETGKR